MLSSVVTHATGKGTRSKVTSVALAELRKVSGPAMLIPHGLFLTWVAVGCQSIRTSLGVWQSRREISGLYTAAP